MSAFAGSNPAHATGAGVDTLPAAPGGSGRPQRGIQSMEVGGRLLNSLTAAEGPMMLKDLAAAASLSAANAHPYLVSLIKLGLVEQDAASGRYSLGAFALEMGLAAMRQRDEIRMAAHCATALAAATGLSVAVAVWGNLGATVVQLVPARRPLHVALRTGSVLSLVNTATGRIFGAYLPESVWAGRLACDGDAVGGDPAGRTGVHKELFARVRERGMARADGLPIPGVNAFSAPVFDHDGGLLLSMTILGAAGDLAADWDNPLAAELREACRGLSRQLGWRARD
ncbi:MAG: IclR family transcriptional regulator [Burkholderiaceae bacterium]